MSRRKQRRIILNEEGARPYFLRDPDNEDPLSPDEFARAAVGPYLGKSFDMLFWSLADATVFPTRMESAEMFGGDPAQDVDDLLTELLEEARRIRLGQTQQPDVGAHQARQPDLPAHADIPTDARRFAHSYVQQCRRLWAEGTDDLELVVREGHKHGLEVFASIRMNDTHFRGDTAIIEWCRFNREHPEFNLDGPRSEFDYAHPEVRDWRFSHIQELAQKWDIDGIELDFNRFPVYFKEPAAEKAPFMTDLMGRVRATLDKAGQRRGRPILLAVRPLETFEMSLSVGLDVREWLARGWIDLLIAGGGYMSMDLPIEEIVQTAHDVGCPVYACINYPRSEAYLRGWAANAYPKGVDGLYLFNSFAPSTDLPVYSQLGDPANLVGNSKLFDAQHRFLNCPWHSDNMVWQPSLPLPKDLSTGFAEFPILMNEDFTAAAAQGLHPVASLRLTITGLVGDDVFVYLNGHELTEGTVPKDTPTQIELAEWEVPVDQKENFHMAKILAPTHEYAVSLEWLVNGRNQVEVSVPFDKVNWARTDFARCPLAITLVAANMLLDYSV